MTVEQIILAVLKNYRNELRQQDNRDGINKIYRQARIWSRIMASSGIISEDERNRANEAFKKMRWNRLNKIEEE